MEEKILENYLRAGKIASQVLNYGSSLVKNNALVIDIAEKIESKILDLGGESAFPVNISINDIAAHFHPTINDKTVINETDYVKLDVGVHVDGYIADTATTIRPAGKDRLIECSEKMLEKALSMAKPGTTLGEIGEAIENVAKDYGFNSVRNLTGHSLSRFDLHAGTLIYNIKHDSLYQLREDEIYAIEPFCTPGFGFVKDSGSPLIFRWMNDRTPRIPEGRKILDLAKNKYNRLPFAKRWVQKMLSPLKVELSLKELQAIRAIYGYRPLREESKMPVAQSEHTVIIKEEPIVTTYLQ